MAAGSQGLVSIAIDDVDAPNGGCTTHFTGLLLNYLLDRGARLADYPLLVRLNPGIPWKTRGNAATVLRLRGVDEEELLEITVGLLDEYTADRPTEPGKAPGVAVVRGYPWRPQLRALYRMALTGVVARDAAEKAVARAGGVLRGGRGAVGAASALAALAPWDDYTFELIYYRRPELWGKPRCIRWRGEAGIPPCAFNNSYPGGGVAAAPRGLDPVLAGFRGDCPQGLHRYYTWLCEEPHFWVLYRSNQHTDAPALLGEPRAPHPYNYYAGWATVTGRPRRIAGGHTLVEAAAGRARATLAFYRETWPLNVVASLLEPGDKLWVMGSVRPYGDPVTIAVDKLRVARLARKAKVVAPLCPRCGHRMKSAGRGRGYKCPRCGYHDPLAKPVVIEEPRSLAPGWYAPSEGRLRHLIAPPGRRPRARSPPPPRPEEVTGARPPSQDTHVNLL